MHIDLGPWVQSLRDNSDVGVSLWFPFFFINSSSLLSMYKEYLAFKGLS